MESLKEALIKKHAAYVPKNPFGLTGDDLVGALKVFPMGVVVRMMEEQKNQKNKSNVKVFQTHPDADHEQGAFTWSITEGGSLFWDNVICGKMFDLFFKKYPEYKKYNL